MDKSAFLKNPDCMDPRDVPSEWMAEAWTIDAVRANQTYGLARAVGKCGELAFTQGYLDLLARSLSDEQLVELYCEIRDLSDRDEVEWRGEFERTFPRVVASLPAPRLMPGIDDFLCGSEMRVGWARDAWEDDRVSAFVTSHMAQDLAQGGGFWCRPEWLEHLDLCLTRAQIVRLYTELRDQSERPEREWRHILETAFPDCIAHLPEPLDPGMKADEGPAMDEGQPRSEPPEIA